MKDTAEAVAQALRDAGMEDVAVIEDDEVAFVLDGRGYFLTLTPE